MKVKLLATVFAISLCTQFFSQVKYYINSSSGQPWGQTTNSVSMDAAFGAGNWTQAYFETVNTVALFQPTTCFIFMDGSDANALALNTFLTNNLTALQNWVSAGGKLFLNAAPNQGSSMNFGFGGVTCNYPVYSTPGTAAAGMTAYPIFNGPAVPTGTTFTGNSYAHASITGGTMITVMDGAAAPVCTEMFWGQGRVMFGGMTTTNFHSPSPNGNNLRSNIFSMLGGCCGAAPSISVVASSSNICAGQSVTLMPSGLASGTYAIWPGAQTGTAIVLTPSVTSAYNIIGTPTTGCAGGVTIKINVGTSPTLAISGNTAICPNGTANLTVSGAATYSWTNGPNTNTIAVTPTANAVYTVVGTNSTGCTSTITTSVIINPNPTVSISGSQTVCSGSTLNLTGNGANTYSWSNGNIGANIAVSPTANTIYSVTGNQAGCTGTAAISVTMFITPTVAISGGTAIICAGNTVALTASGANSYSWNNGPITANMTATPPVSTSYTVVGTSVQGCTASAVKIVTVSPSPNVSAQGGPNPLCAGQQATLMAFGAATYSWSTGATTSSNVVAPGGTITFTVIGTNTAGCSSNALITVTVGQAPFVNVSGGGTLCAGQIATLSATGANSYSWNNGALTSTVTVNPNTSTIYTVVGTSTAGCSANATVAVNIVICTETEKNSLFSTVKFYPNPAQDEIIIEGINQEVRLEIFDLNGKLLISKNISLEKNKIIISSLPAGVYMARMQDGKSLAVLRLVKE